MQSGQHLLTQARSLDSTIARLSQMESAIRGSHMLRTFEPASEIPEGGFLHHRFQGTMFPPFIDEMRMLIFRNLGTPTPMISLFVPTRRSVPT